MFIGSNNMILRLKDILASFAGIYIIKYNYRFSVLNILIGLASFMTFLLQVIVLGVVGNRNESKYDAYAQIEKAVNFYFAG